MEDEVNMTNCTAGLTLEMRQKILLCRTVVSVLSFVGSLTAFIFVACLRLPTKYQVFKDIAISTRMMLYINGAALFRSIATMAQVTSYVHDDIKHIDHYSRSCVAIGFLNHFSAWIAILFTLMGTIYVFKYYFLYLKNMRKQPLTNLIQQNSKCSFCRRYFRLEYVYVLFPLLVSFIFSLPPFIENSYGIAGGWCWIRSRNEDCSEHVLGVALRYATWYVPSIIIKLVNTGLILASFVMICKVYCDLKKFELDHKFEDFNQVHAQVISIMICSIVYLVLNWIGFTNRTIIKVKNSHDISLWIFHAFASSCWGLIAGIALIIYLLIRVYVQVKAERRKPKRVCEQTENDFDISMLVSLSAADGCVQAAYSYTNLN